tara:strand:+ start:248 stop:559 length:312 start_codon:yes stop_codon:yes gene_type:complete
VQPSNTLKIESLSDDWCDKDLVILHASFQLLKDCVEIENLLNGHTDWEADDKHRNAKPELQSLYTWWVQRAKEDPMDDLAKAQYKEDTEMLHRLIEVRWALWT